MEADTPPPIRTGPGRDVAMDALRTLAVLLMVASHTTRLIVWEHRREWSRLSLLIEPLTASLFLFLVGASLVRSWEKARPQGRGAWFRKQGLRALGLWVVSGIFYMLELGFHWPDSVFLSGILATIAYAVLVLAPIVASPRPVLLLSLASAAMGCFFLWMDQHGIRVFFLNAGNSPWLPLVLFAFMGSLGALAVSSRAAWVRPAWVAAAVVALGLLLYFHSFHDLFSKPLGRYETVRTMASGPPEARIEKAIPYYNLRPILVPAIVALIVLIYAALAALRPVLAPAARLLFPMGRHSLDVYILHLALLAVLVLRGGKRPLTSAWQGDVTLASVILACYVWASGREWLKSRPRAIHPSGK